MRDLKFPYADLSSFASCVAGFNSSNLESLGVLDFNGGFLCDIVAVGDEADNDLDLVIHSRPTIEFVSVVKRILVPRHLQGSLRLFVNLE